MAWRVWFALLKWGPAVPCKYTLTLLQELAPESLRFVPSFLPFRSQLKIFDFSHQPCLPPSLPPAQHQQIVVLPLALFSAPRGCPRRGHYTNTAANVVLQIAIRWIPINLEDCWPVTMEKQYHGIFRGTKQADELFSCLNQETTLLKKKHPTPNTRHTMPF